MNQVLRRQLPTDVEYPESDGEPKADYTKQLVWIFVLYGNLAALFRHQPDVFVGGNLEDTVAGGVDDGLAGADMFFAKFLDDFGAGGGFVAEGLAADLFFEFGDEFAREAVRVDRESLGEPDAGHFPVAGGGVFARRRQGAFSESRDRPIHGTYVRQRFEISQAQLRHVRQVQLAGRSDVSQGVAARVPISGGVRHLAGSYTVQHDPRDATERRSCH